MCSLYPTFRVSWAGQWVWDKIAPSIYEILQTTEPTNLSNLDNLLKILQGSSLSNERIEALVSRKCSVLEEPDHVARWFAVWSGVAPEAAIASFKARIEEIADPKTQTLFAMMFLTHLMGGRRGEGSGTRHSFKTPEYLKSLYLLMNKHIQTQEDIQCSGTEVSWAELRDDAQDARNRLLNLLNKIPGKESFFALHEIAAVHPDVALRPWIMLHAKNKAEQDGDIVSWSPKQVRDFYEMLERTPTNHRELAELAVLRLLDLKDDLEHGDYSISSTLQRGAKQETEMRNFIGWYLREKAFGRYKISQEDEFADAKRPDLRFHGEGFDGPVPVELKLVDKNWTGPKLFERLENQLCGDYLRDTRSTRGIFLLVYLGEYNTKHWTLPGSNQRVDFAELIAALHEHWIRISPKFSDIDDITVIGIDLTKRTS